MGDRVLTITVAVVRVQAELSDKKSQVLSVLTETCIFIPLKIVEECIYKR